MTSSPDDCRRSTGMRLTFGPQDRDLWYLVHVCRTLGQEHRRRVILMAEVCVQESAMEAVEVADAAAGKGGVQ
jgi:hypothetical protein